MIESIIKKLNLYPLPQEGGYFNETYRSQIMVPGELINNKESRNISTAIYFLVTETNYSLLHKIQYDEIFHFYGGDSVQQIQFDEKQQKLNKITIGSDVLNDEQPQVIVPANTWQGLKIKKIVKGYALLGTTVSPGFDFNDFVVGNKELLTRNKEFADELEKYL